MQAPVIWTPPTGTLGGIGPIAGPSALVSASSARASNPAATSSSAAIAASQARQCGPSRIASRRDDVSRSVTIRQQVMTFPIEPVIGEGTHGPSAVREAVKWLLNDPGAGRNRQLEHAARRAGGDAVEQVADLELPNLDDVLIR